jgi:uncharacterized membrane protein
MNDFGPGFARRESATRATARWLLILAYLAAGVVHLWRPAVFLPIIPHWVPLPREVTLVTGVCEIMGAIGLMMPRFRRAAGVMLALYAVCVFPANIKHAIDDLSAATGLGWDYHVPRLAAQPLIVWWSLWVGSLVDWPFAQQQRRERADTSRERA